MRMSPVKKKAIAPKTLRPSWKGFTKSSLTRSTCSWRQVS